MNARVLLSPLLALLFHQVGATAYTVNTNAGTSTGSGTSGSLLYCIAQSNLSAGPHTITFDPAMAGQTITCAGFGNYSFNSSSVTLDGTTLPGYTCGLPVIKIDVSAVGQFRFTGTNNTLKGIAVVGGIQMTAGSGNKVQGCTFQLDLNGTTIITPGTIPTGGTIYITGGSGNKIGGTTACERNIIASVGARAFYDNGSAGNNIFSGNYCGTLRDGLTATTPGLFTAEVIYLRNSSVVNDSIKNNIVGRGTLGIYNDGAGKTFVYNNNIGANVNRLFQTDLGFTSTPIAFDGTAADFSEIDGNVSGNTSYVGGYANGSNIGIFDGGNDNFIVRNNYVGVDINFNKSGAAWCGIFTRGSAATITNNYVGDNGIRNTTQYSHGIATETASNCTISNNWIGVSATGANVGNGDAGIEINGGSSITISGNVIGFNKGLRTSTGASSGSGGIQLINAPSTVTISDNYIGTTPTLQDCGNLYDGIYTEKATTVIISQNKIAYNDRNGINIAYKTGGGGGPSNYVFVTQNCMWCNTSKGILLTTGGQNNVAAGATSFGESYTNSYGTFTAVQINPFTGADRSDSTTTVGTLVLKGYAPANSYVEVFKVEPCKGCGSTGNEEGQVYIGNTTTNANGLWTYSLPTNNIGRGITVTASSANASPSVTSEYSSCLALTNQCNIMSNVLMNPTNGTLQVCSGATLSFTGTYTAKPYAGCPNMFNVSWYRDATLLSGPTQNTSGTASYSRTMAASGDAGIYSFTVSDALPNAPACTSRDTVKVAYCVPLAVQVLSFDGYPDDDRNELVWNMQSDEQALITIQKSTDGKTFEDFEQRTMSSGLSVEHAWDINPAVLSYYRLRVTPQGSAEYLSSIVSINRNTGLEISITGQTGNMVQVQITSGIDQETALLIYDTRGVVLSDQRIAVTRGKNLISLNAVQLSSAMYIVRCDGMKNYESDRAMLIRQ